MNGQLVAIVEYNLSTGHIEILVIIDSDLSESYITTHVGSDTNGSHVVYATSPESIATRR